MTTHRTQENPGLKLCFIIRMRIRNQPKKKKRHIGGSLGGPNCRAFLSSPMEKEAHWCVHQSGSSTELWYSILLALYYIDVIGWIIIGLKTSTVYHIVDPIDLCGQPQSWNNVGSHHESPLQNKHRCDPMGPAWIKKALKLRKISILRCLVPGMWDKD